MQKSEMKWKCPKCGREFSRRDQDHYCIRPKNIDEYISMQDERVQPVLAELRTLLRETLPEAEETISWSMPTYKKGRNIIHFAAFRKHFSIYPGEEAAAAFADDLKDYDVAKGTIRFPYDRQLPADLIRRIARWCFEKYAEQK